MLEIQEIVLKYMNLLCFSGKYSKKTALNYVSDLNQFFSPQLNGVFTINPIKFEVYFESNEKTAEKLSPPKSERNQTKIQNDLKNLHDFISQSYSLSKGRLTQISLISRKRKLSALKNFISWCLDEELMTKDPLVSLVSPKVSQKIPRYLNLDEIINYLQSLKSDYLKEPAKFRFEYLNFLVLFGMGLRLEESCTLENKNLDLQNSRIKILGKGQKVRFGILPEFMIQEFSSLISKDTKYIYGPKPLVGRTAYNWIRKRGLKAGLHKPVHPHMFRHSYATHLLRQKTDLRHLQELLGHSSIVATQRYTHLDKSQILENLEDFHPLSKIKTL